MLGHVEWTLVSVAFVVFEYQDINHGNNPLHKLPPKIVGFGV